MSHSIRRFDFEGLQDFSVPFHLLEAANDHTLPEEAEVETPPPPPSFSQEELEAAKAAAYESGRSQGAKEEAARQTAASAAREEATQRAAELLCQRAASMEKNFTEFKASQTTQLAALLRLMVDKIAGNALEADPHRAIEAMIDDCLGILQTEPRIIIEVHPDSFNPIGHKLRGLAQTYHLQNTITVKENVDLAPSEARMDWGSGSAERRLKNIWTQIETIIGGIDFSSLAEDTKQQPTTNNDNQGENNE